jgi:hypothetical protein
VQSRTLMALGRTSRAANSILSKSRGRVISLSASEGVSTIYTPELALLTCVPLLYQRLYGLSVN